ncbi:hypothetical protein BCL69_100642 [Nitrosomonas communis]|uniref:Uncharacterized protein n=1 Tax=Nitrosomonas communis TaxID=44574 RepID=A0A5D3YFY6_9PROT|nr:hypothetical protein BCL69_100642 [Nitrosomonas communis]
MIIKRIFCQRFRLAYENGLFLTTGATALIKDTAKINFGMPNAFEANVY